LISTSISLPEELSQYEKAIQRVQQFLRKEEEGLETPRTQIWQEGWKSYTKKPIFGYGIGNFSEKIGNAPHNDFLRVLFETGIVGICIFINIYFATLRNIQKANTIFYPGYGLCILVLCFISSCLLGLLQDKFFWFAMATCWLRLKINPRLGDGFDMEKGPLPPPQAR